MSYYDFLEKKKTHKIIPWLIKKVSWYNLKKKRTFKIKFKLLTKSNIAYKCHTIHVVICCYILSFIIPFRKHNTFGNYTIHYPN